jgi:alpha-tubulin suppressor-like RCC1 family protein
MLKLTFMKRFLFLVVFGLLFTATANTQTISARWEHSLSICDNGVVMAWGKNNYGQLGDGTTMEKTNPVEVNSLADITAVSTGDLHSIFLKSDGTVWAVGRNISGQLGDGTNVDRLNPVQMIGLTDVISITSGNSHSIALKNDGTVWAVGSNSYGALGDGTTTSKNTPVQVSNLTNIIAVAAGSFHSLALKSDGTVWTWGYNTNGQLGLGYESVFVTVPVQVPDFYDVKSISGGWQHSVFLRENGTVWTCGWNNYGILGDGTFANNPSPVQVLDLTDVVDIDGGTYHSMALKNDGTVWTWGRGAEGQLGYGGTNGTGEFPPVQVLGLAGISAIAAGSVYSIALKNDGLVWCWGKNDYRQLGDETTTQRNIPVQTQNLCQVAPPTDYTLKGVYGEVYNDINENCIKENESLLRGRKFLVNPGNIIVETIGKGNWYIDSLPLGTYTIT